MLVIIFSHLFTSYLLGPVTEVKTDIYVTSFGPVSDVEMVGIWGLKENKPEKRQFIFIILSITRNQCLIKSL